MQAGSVSRIEKNVDRAASGLLACACAYGSYAPLAGRAAWLPAAAAALAFAAAAYLLASWLLGRVDPGPRAPAVPRFEVRDFERAEARHCIVDDADEFPEFEALSETQLLAIRGRDRPALPKPTDFPEAPQAELLLTERYEPQSELAPEPLLLDEIAAGLDPDSRVVRLFGEGSAPTPGQLKSRIDRHLERSAPEPQSFDAAQALHEALAELRRSIR